MKKSPKVSVIIPIYNHGKFIGRAIQSILDQSFKDFEIVITNDGSNDNTLSEINKYKDPRIKLLCFDRNKGMGMAMNNCIRNSSGKYIASLNADDTCSSDRLSKQSKFLDDHKSIGAVFSYANIIDDNDKQINDHIFYKTFRQKNRSRFEWLHRFFYEGNCLCHPSAMVRKKCYDDIGLYDGRFQQIQDLELWVRLCMKYDIHIIPEELSNFRIISGEANVSSNTPEKNNRFYWESIKVLYHFLKLEKDELMLIFPEIKKRFYKTFDKQFLPYYLAMIALEIEDPRFRFYAINLLCDLIKNEKIVDRLENLYNFNYSSFIKISGELDTFNILELDRRAKVIENQNKTIGEQNKIIIEGKNRATELEREIKSIKSSGIWKIKETYKKIINSKS